MKFSWNKFFIKLSSRKLWLVLASFAVSCGGLFGINNDILIKISSLILMLGTIVIYFVSDMLETKNNSTAPPVDITPITPDDICNNVPENVAADTSANMQTTIDSIDPAGNKFF